MSTTINSYLYDNKILVQVLDEDPQLKTRHRIVYSRTLKIYKNVDNPVTINFRNNDQKPANLAARTFTFSITDPASNTAVWTSSVNVVDAELSVGTVIIDQANVAALTQELYNYSVTYDYGNLKLAAYTDDNWGAIGQLQVLSNSYS